MHTPQNIFSELPDGVSGQEILEEIITLDMVRIERIISTGQISPEGFWYDQDDNEWVLLLQGNARIEFKKGKEAVLAAGDYLFLPAHQKHRITFTSVDPSCIWLAVYWPPQPED